MFSTGQLIFAALFFIVFVILIAASYRKDVAVHKLFYKGNYKVLIVFFLFIVMLFVIKLTMKR